LSAFGANAADCEMCFKGGFTINAYGWTRARVLKWLM